MKAKHAWLVGVSLLITLVALTGILYVEQAELLESQVAPEITAELASTDTSFLSPLGLDCRPCAEQCGGWDNILQCSPTCICKLN